ncbi:hypothetical protein N431DRAFT_196363 [Stipitochalara longipes BDJ]|nr:hypothetical protein N431DRAFT_196363 [Stipitochalara longipes BDJ]
MYRAASVQSGPSLLGALAGGSAYPSILLVFNYPLLKRQQRKLPGFFDVVPRSFDVEMARLSRTLLADSVFRGRKPRKEGFTVDRAYHRVGIFSSNQPWSYARLNWEQISLRSEMQGECGAHLWKHLGCLFGWFGGRLMGP